MDITPTPRATAIVCIEILKGYIPTQKRGACDNNALWAEQQILKMIITDWPEEEE
jgi:hypothetical protein